jgi:hypothetical protein
MMRYAQYAAAVLFALLAIALVALWVRSYTWDDMLLGSVGRAGISVESCDGVVTLMTYRNPNWTGWKLTGGPRAWLGGPFGTSHI